MPSGCVPCQDLLPETHGEAEVPEVPGWRIYLVEYRAAYPDWDSWTYRKSVMHLPDLPLQVDRARWLYDRGVLPVGTVTYTGLHHCQRHLYWCYHHQAPG